MELVTAFPSRPRTPEFTLGVNHFIQNNNTGGDGYRECNLTSAAMLADYLLGGIYYKAWKAGQIKQPEDTYAKVLAMYGDTTDHGDQTDALAELGIRSYFTHTSSLNDAASSLYCGVPVLIGTKYKASGHIVLLTGRDSTGFSVLCPYGIRNGDTDTWAEIFQSEADAKIDHYSWSLLKRIFTDMGSEAGWARYVTHVNGRPTGVKSGL